MSEKINLFDLNLAGLEQFFASIDEPRFRAVQVLQWIHQRGIIDFAEMSNLSKNLRAKLAEMAVLDLPAVSYRQESKDGTYKWLFRLHDGNIIETVFIPETSRGTLCISSQVGCALNCSFCSTGKEGFNRNLSVSEIIGQVWMAKQELAILNQTTDRQITNVVLMGMGEPLLNYQPVLQATELMLSDNAYGLSKYRVTLSTSGVIPALRDLQRESEVALAVSLHAPNDELRNKLVPINKKYPLAELMKVCRNYYNGSNRRVVFEYVMLAGVNDSIQHARELVRLLANVPCKVNLIPFNPFPQTHYQASAPEVVTIFQDYLTSKGVATWVRKTRGQDIDAACGQLAGQIQDRTGRNARWLRTGSLIPIPVVTEETSGLPH